MHDLHITIVEEHTKRVCRNFALTHMRRRTITIEEEAPTNQQQKSKHLPPISKVNPRTTTTTTTTTTSTTNKGVPPNTTTNSRTTREYLLPSYSAAGSTSLTVAVPTSSTIKVWAEEDKDQNIVLHIKKQRGDRCGLPTQRSI